MNTSNPTLQFIYRSDDKFRVVERIVDEDSARYFYSDTESMEIVSVMLSSEGIIIETFVVDEDGNDIPTGNRHELWDGLLADVRENS